MLAKFENHHNIVVITSNTKSFKLVFFTIDITAYFRTREIALTLKLKSLLQPVQ